MSEELLGSSSTSGWSRKASSDRRAEIGAAANDDHDAMLWVSKHFLFRMEAEVIAFLQRVIGPPATYRSSLKSLKFMHSGQMLHRDINATVAGAAVAAGHRSQAQVRPRALR